MLGSFGCDSAAAEWLHFKEQLPLLFLPLQILTLAGQKCWETIMLSAAWNRDAAVDYFYPAASRSEMTMWPEAAWLRRLRDQKLLNARCPESDLPFECRHASTLCRRLREWAPAIIEHAGDDAAQVMLILQD